jgi:hypothetical protein
MVFAINPGTEFAEETYDNFKANAMGTFTSLASSALSSSSSPSSPPPSTSPEPSQTQANTSTSTPSSSSTENSPSTLADISPSKSSSPSESPGPGKSLPTRTLAGIIAASVCILILLLPGIGMYIKYYRRRRQHAKKSRIETLDLDEEDKGTVFAATPQDASENGIGNGDANITTAIGGSAEGVVGDLDTAPPEYHTVAPFDRSVVFARSAGTSASAGSHGHRGIGMRSKLHAARAATDDGIWTHDSDSKGSSILLVLATLP